MEMECSHVEKAHRDHWVQPLALCSAIRVSNPVSESRVPVLLNLQQFVAVAL